MSQTQPVETKKETQEKPVKRQLVNFCFYKLSPVWRLLTASEKESQRNALEALVEKYRTQAMIFTYSLVGIRGDVDFMLWRIADSADSFQKMSAEINQSTIGAYLTTPYSFLSMTKRSIYVDKHVHEGQEGRRGVICPGLSKYLFIYPFVKTRDWYLLPMEERQEMMNHHIEIGHKFPRVKLNTTYSFGLDDQDFVVAFETDYPEDFLDLVMALRETRSSKYTQRDTPIFTCVQQELKEILKSLG